MVVIASNDPFVMSAWGKANYTKDDFIVSFYSIFSLFLVLYFNSLPLLLPLIHGIFLSLLLLVVSSPFFHPAWFFFSGGIN